MSFFVCVLVIYYADPAMRLWYLVSLIALTVVAKVPLSRSFFWSQHVA